MPEIGTATNKRLLDLFNMMKGGELILAPSFQRKLVWNNSHKENFIETILLSLPFPEIYLAAGELDLASQRSLTLVVDGQQRLNTIYEYVTSSPDFSIKRIRTFEELSNKEKTNFFDYIVVVRDLGRIEQEKIREIFKRINSVQYALNAIEISNSLYEGEFITTAKRIVEDSEFFKKINIFTEEEFSRMKDIEFILLIMSTLEEGGYFTGTKEIENYVKRYDSEYSNKSKTFDLLMPILSLIVSIELPPDSLWYRRSALFTLIIELSKFQEKTGNLPSQVRLRDVLMNIEYQVYENRQEDSSKNLLAQFYYSLHQNTGSKKGRITRGSILQKRLEEAVLP